MSAITFNLNIITKPQCFKMQVHVILVLYNIKLLISVFLTQNIYGIYFRRFNHYSFRVVRFLYQFVLIFYFLFNTILYFLSKVSLFSCNISYNDPTVLRRVWIYELQYIYNKILNPICFLIS